MLHSVPVREVRERSLASVHISVEQGIPAPSPHPLVVRSAMFAIEDYVSISGRLVASKEVPVSARITLDAFVDGLPLWIEQPADPERFTHLYPPVGRWVASDPAVNGEGTNVSEWYPVSGSTHRGIWHGIGTNNFLPSRGMTSPMFGYRGEYGWPVMDAVELNGRGSITMRHEPQYGHELALMALGTFDVSDDAHVLLDMRSLEVHGYSLVYDWDSRLLSLEGVYGDSKSAIPNPMVPGRLSALILAGSAERMSARVICDGHVVGASLGRFEVPMDQITDLSISCGTHASSRLVEVCVWQGAAVDVDQIVNQANTLLSYYERRQP